MKKRKWNVVAAGAVLVVSVLWCGGCGKTGVNGVAAGDFETSTPESGMNGVTMGAPATALPKPAWAPMATQKPRSTAAPVMTTTGPGVNGVTMGAPATALPKPAWALMATQKPASTVAPVTTTLKPAVAPMATQNPKPTVVSVATQTPKSTVAPMATYSPKFTAAPVTTTLKPGVNGVTEGPSMNFGIAVTEAPAVTHVPKPTTVPAATTAPRPTVAPAVTQSPKPTATPVATEAPKPTAAPEHVHVWEEGWFQAPDCTYGGDGHYRVCRLCSATEDLPDGSGALGHRKDGGSVILPPTCSQTGIRGFTCVRCGQRLEDEVIPADDSAHDWWKDETGLTYCTECGAVRLN